MNDNERLGQAMDDADLNLPAGFRLRIEIGRDVETEVELVFDGDAIDCSGVTDEDDLASLITAAVDLAISLKEQTNGTA